MEICFIESKFIFSLSYQEENHCKSMFCFRCEIEPSTEGSFCFVCGARKKNTLIGDNTFSEREFICYYFHCGYDYKASVNLLKTHCDISLSERTLKRSLQKYNLRKNSFADNHK